MPGKSVGAGNICALLLEDEPLIAMGVEEDLNSAGIGVSTVLSCEDANAWLDANTPDLVIVDIWLRDGGAFSVVHRLIDAKIPFIVHSGDREALHHQTPFSAGAWVTKPCLAGELAETARTLVTAA